MRYSCKKVRCICVPQSQFWKGFPLLLSFQHTSCEWCYVISLNLHVNNWIAKMEIGCPRHTGASTIGRQLLDENCSHGWQILATQLWAPMQEQAPITLLRQWKEGGKGDTTKMPEKCLMYVCHNTIHKQVELRHMHICVYIADYQGNPRPLCY